MTPRTARDAEMAPRSEIAPRFEMTSIGGPDPASFDSAALWAPVTDLPDDADRWLPLEAAARAVANAAPVEWPVEPAGTAVPPDNRQVPRSGPVGDELEGWPGFDERARV